MRVAFSSIDWNTLQLAGRARDDAQHLGGRGLLLQRFGDCSRASASSWVRASSCFFNSISELGPLLTRALTFVPVSPRVGLFAPLRDKVTSSARLVDLCWLLQTSFDHLVGAAEQRQWECDAKRPCGIEVDNQLDLYGLLHREVGRRFAFEDAADIDGGLSICFRNIGPITHQAAGGSKLAPLKDCR